MIVNILFYILIFIVSFSLESFLSVFGGFSMIVILTLFLFKKVDWKVILTFGVLLAICLDVANHYVLGTNLLLLGAAVLFFYLFTLIFPEQNNLLGLVPFLFSFVVYYLMKLSAPSLLLFGTLGSIQGPDIWGIIIMSVLSSVLIYALSALYELFRGNKVSSKIVLK